MKRFMREYLKHNPLSEKQQEKIGIVCHGFIIYALLAEKCKEEKSRYRMFAEESYVCGEKFFTNCEA